MHKRVKVGVPLLRRIGSAVWRDSHYSSRTEGHRLIRIPLGGLTEDLPSSLGGSNKKDGGGLSTVNLRTKLIERDQLLRRRKKLHFPCEEFTVPQDARQKSVPAASVGHRTPSAHAPTQDGPSNESVPEDPSHALSQRLSISEHTSSSSSSPGTDSPTALCVRVDEMMLERRFAVTPASTVFGSDLDRLERDILRDHHQQQAGKLPRLDSAFSRFGAGRAGKRLAWEPSSSLDKMSTADVTPRVGALHRYGSRDNYNLAARLMHAECFQYTETTATTAVGDDGCPRGSRRGVCAARHTVEAGKQDAACSEPTRHRGDAPESYGSWQKSAADDTKSSKSASLPCTDCDDAAARPTHMREHFPDDDVAESDRFGDADVQHSSSAFTSGRHQTADEAKKEYPFSSSSLRYEARVREWYAKRCGSAAQEEVVSPHRTVHAARNPRVYHVPENEQPLVSHRSHNEEGGGGISHNGAAGGGVVYDAFCQRPAEPRWRTLRGAEYWSDHRHRDRLEQHTRRHVAEVQREMLQEGVMQTSRVEHGTNLLRKETFLYFQAHPINEMIQESFVRIRQMVSPHTGHTHLIAYNSYQAERSHDQAEESVSVARDARNDVDGSDRGDDAAVLPPTRADTNDVYDTAADDEESSVECATRVVRAHVDIPIQQARQMAHELGVDLIRVGAYYTQKSDRRIVAICLLADHRVHMREMIRFKMQRVGVQAPTTPACIEVGFRGGTHPHAIRFKSVGIAKHILHGHTIRINLTKFGTPHEGFPVLQTILDEVKRQCLQLHAYHRAGVIQANYDEIFLYLYPSTGRSPKTSVEHPSGAQMTAARDYHVARNEKEIFFDDLHGQLSARSYQQYLSKLEEGTAWADKDAGLSLQRQRALKVMLGYLPKGNSEIYAARGDVNVPAPFRSTHPTSVDAWTYPRESNLEQASRGAAVLGKRLAMPISEMHDRGETAEESTVIDRFYYRAQGPVLKVGELKEALGLKNNRRKSIALGPGFATLGMANGGAPIAPASQATR